MIKEILKKLSLGENLSLSESSALIDVFASGEVTQAQIGACLMGLKQKGETVDEISGFALRMRELAVQINIEGIGPVVDSCGTGGDGANTFNISTASAILASSSGLNVAKHSNYGFTSRSGSSNVLEALCVALENTSFGVENSLKNHNIAFIHAPYFHSSTKTVGPVRKELGFRTVFNYLGPLTNPASPTGQVLGVSNPDMALKLVNVLANLGLRRAFVVCGVDPLLDELSLCGKTHVFRLNADKIDSFEVFPEDFGFKRVSIDELEGGSPDFNAGIIEDILKGVLQGPKRDAVVLNTAALLWTGEKVESIQDGIVLANELIDSGMAYKKLENMRNE